MSGILNQMSISSVKERREKICQMSKTRIACTNLLERSLGSHSHHWWEQSASDVDFMRKTKSSQMIYLMNGSFAL
jgi:hypothetical protein